MALKQWPHCTIITTVVLAALGLTLFGIALVLPTGALVALVYGYASSEADPADRTTQTQIYTVLDQTRNALGNQGLWVSNDAVMQLVLSSQPGFDHALDAKAPVLFEDVVEEYFFNAQEWHWLQRRMVYGIVTLHLLRVVNQIANPALRRRHLAITKERPFSVLMSWVCVIAAGLLLTYVEVALGGWAAILATIGLVIQLDLSYTRHSSTRVYE